MKRSDSINEDPSILNWLSFKANINTEEVNDLNEYVFTNFLVVFVHASEDTLKQRHHSRTYDQIIESYELAIVQSRFEALLKYPHVLKYDSATFIACRVMVEKILLMISL